MADLPPIFSSSIAMPQPKPSGGMFGGSGKFGLKEALAMGLAGFVSRRNPQLLQGLMQALMLKQRDKQEEQRYQRERGDKFSDFQREYDYKLAHPDTSGAPHYFEDNSGNVHAVMPDLSVTDVYTDPNPWKLVPNGMGGVVPVNMQELMRGAAKPLTDEDIDRLGGPTQPASGGFPRY